MADRRAAAAQAHPPGRCALWCRSPAAMPCVTNSFRQGWAFKLLRQWYCTAALSGATSAPRLPLSPATPFSLVAEARGGLHIVEQSLWSSLPKLLRRMSSERSLLLYGTAGLGVFIGPAVPSHVQRGGEDDCLAPMQPWTPTQPSPLSRGLLLSLTCLHTACPCFLLIVTPSRFYCCPLLQAP